MLLTHQELEDIIFFARYYPNKSYSDLMEPFLSEKIFPTLDGNTQNLIEKYSNHQILVELEGNEDASDGDYNFFRLFRTDDNDIREINKITSVDVKDRRWDYRGGNNSIKYPKMTRVWTKENLKI